MNNGFIHLFIGLLLISLCVTSCSSAILTAEIPEATDPLGDTVSQVALEIAPQVGALAPEIQLASLEGELIHLSDFRGSVVLINFWATWCPPCLVELPSFQERYERYQPDLVVLAVNFEEAEEDVEAFVNENEYTFPIVLDSHGKIHDLYQIRGNPTSFIVDEEGIVQVKHIGLMVDSLLDQYLTQLGIEK